MIISIDTDKKERKETENKITSLNKREREREEATLYKMVRKSYCEEMRKSWHLKNLEALKSHKE